MLFHDFVSEIESKNLIQKNTRVVVAVSGGIDSMCLLHLMVRLRALWHLEILCAHVNHHLRDEADDDAKFVQKICMEWDVPFILHNAMIAKKAKEERISTELAGRIVRYDFFKQIPCDAIVTAHNKNDVAETVFMHLLRGCGLSGLCGIAAKRKDSIVRPLLSFSRENIQSYINMHNIPWREDSTNSSILYTRNKIRHELIPKALTFNPSFLDAVYRMTFILQQENEYMEQEANKLSAYERIDGICRFSIAKLASAPPVLRARVFRQAVQNYEDVQKMESLLSAQNGTTFALSSGLQAVKEYDYITVFRPDLSVPKSVQLPKKGRIQFGQYEIKVGEGGMKLKQGLYYVRTRQNGDSFRPEGMQGKKKLKDFFIDEKIPKRLRDFIPIIVNNDKIAAVSQLRRSADFVPQPDEAYTEIMINRLNFEKERDTYDAGN
ncbi:MAG: tRNA lysidine(34) synthetase TilS [Clostridia bacterium]|nr:tRNA lysidine(34) synthetase TilS [Clostridia bacterium]